MANENVRLFLHAVLNTSLKISKTGLSSGDGGPTTPLAKKRRVYESESDADYESGQVSFRQRGFDRKLTSPLG